MSSSDVFSSAVTRNLMKCVLLFGVSWCWVVLGGCDVFLLLHCTSCLFDNSSVKLCKHDTPFLFAPQGANDEQSLGWGHGCKAKNTPVGCFSGSAVCEANGGALPRQAIPQQDYFGNAGALQKRSPGWTGNFQELKICGHGTVLAVYRCAQNASSTNVSELLRCAKCK